MKVIKVIRLFDGSQHSTKQQALRRLGDILSSGEDLTFLESLSHKNTLQIKNILIDKTKELNKICQVLNEIREVEELKFF
jgi:hypothetical protein